MEPIRLWRDPQDGEMRESWPCCDGMTEYAALPRADFDALVKERDEAVARMNDAWRSTSYADVQSMMRERDAATARAERAERELALATMAGKQMETFRDEQRARADALAALLKEARGCVAVNYGPNEFSRLLARIDAALEEKK